ncbi:hypothetical protein PA05_0766 [Cutibacterium acnes P05]|nr:hypothetical protein [Cutibacterium acnes P05]
MTRRQTAHSAAIHNGAIAITVNTVGAVPGTIARPTSSHSPARVSTAGLSTGSAPVAMRPGSVISRGIHGEMTSSGPNTTMLPSSRRRGRVMRMPTATATGYTHNAGTRLIARADHRARPPAEETPPTW